MKRTYRPGRKTRTLVCPACNTTFDTNHRRQIYCSKDCQRHAQKQHRLDRKEKDPYKLEMGMMLLQEKTNVPDLEDDEGIYAGNCSLCGKLVETVYPDCREKPIICVECCEENTGRRPQ